MGAFKNDINLHAIRLFHTAQGSRNDLAYGDLAYSATSARLRIALAHFGNFEVRISMSAKDGEIRSAENILTRESVDFARKLHLTGSSYGWRTQGTFPHRWI
jgi:hypothetical protein